MSWRFYKDHLIFTSTISLCHWDIIPFLKWENSLRGYRDVNAWYISPSLDSRTSSFFFFCLHKRLFFPLSDVPKWDSNTNGNVISGCLSLEGKMRNVIILREISLIFCQNSVIMCLHKSVLVITTAEEMHWGLLGHRIMSTGAFISEKFLQGELQNMFCHSS